MIEFLIALLVVGFFTSPKWVKLLPRRTTPATLVAPTATTATPASPPPAAKPPSKWVWWLIGGVVAILLLTLLWWALPTAGVPDTGASESWFGQLMSNLDLSNTTLGKPVVELVGATWAPIVLIVAIVALVAMAILLIIKTWVAVLVAVILGLVAGTIWGVNSYTEKKIRDANTPVQVNMSRFQVGEISDPERVGLMTTVVINLAQTIKQPGKEDPGVNWACPTTVTPVKLPFQPKFKVAGKYGNKVHFVLTEESKQQLVANGTTVIDVQFTLMRERYNPCANLLY